MMSNNVLIDRAEDMDSSMEIPVMRSMSIGAFWAFSVMN
jgi:hypothetical protein